MTSPFPAKCAWLKALDPYFGFLHVASISEHLQLIENTSWFQNYDKFIQNIVCHTCSRNARKCSKMLISCKNGNCMSKALKRTKFERHSIKIHWDIVTQSAMNFVHFRHFHYHNFKWDAFWGWKNQKSNQISSH